MIVGGRIGQASRSIEDLWVRVEERFAADDVLRNVVFRHGHQYLEEPGHPPRIVLVHDGPELSFGAIRSERDSIGTLTDACKAHIWGLNQDQDYRGPDQFLAAKALAIELGTSAYLEFSGMVTSGIIDVESETQVLKYGESCVMSIRLRCPIEVVTDKKRLLIGGAETRV